MKLTTGLRLCPNNILPEQSAARTPHFLRLMRALAPSPCQLTPFPWRSVLSDEVANGAAAASPFPPSLPPAPAPARPPLGRKLQQA